MSLHRLSRSSVALLLALVAACCCSCVSAACSTSTADPFSASIGRPLATAAGANWLAQVQPAGTGVRFFQTSAAVTNAAGTMLASPRVVATGASAASCGAVPVGVSYAPYFGKSVAMGGSDLVAIGSPNRLGSAVGSFSSIDIVALGALDAAGSAAYSTMATSISDTTSDELGALLSMNSAGTMIASALDSSTVVVYSPVIGRAFSSYNALLANDTKITLPAGFTLDSLSINNGVLVVTGLLSDATTATCSPQILTYTFVAGTPSAWNLAGSANLLRSTSAAVNAEINALPCQSDPSSALPVELSTDASKIIVGSPLQGCAYAISIVASVSMLTHTLTSTGRCADVNLYGLSFGKFVQFSTPSDGSTFVVASAHTANQFAMSEWTATNNPLDPTTATTFYQYPNRMQPAVTSASGAGVTSTAGSKFAPATSTLVREISSIASKGNMTVVAHTALLNGLSSPTGSPDLVALLAANAVPAGQQWNPVTHAVELCAAGRYSTGVGSSYAGCSLCAAGTYSSSQGSSSCAACSTGFYCPTGSVSGFLPTSTYAAGSSSSFVTNLPYLEQEVGLADSFWELLVSKIFSVTAWPAMILFFVLIAVCLVLYIASFWADADGDEQPCCSSMGNCCLHSYRQLGRFKFWTVGRPGPFPYTPRVIEAAPDVIAYDAQGDVRKQQGTVVRRAHGNAVTQHVRNEDGSVTTITTDTVDPAAGYAGQVHRSPECEGFMTLVFILFALSVVCYTGMYVMAYDPYNQDGSAIQNVYRARTEHALSVNTEPEYTQGLSALLNNPFTLSVSFIGLSATQSCSSSLVLGTSWEGCTLSGSAATPCGSVTPVVAWTDATSSYTCELQLSFPTGVSLSASSAFVLTLPSTLSYQALKLGMIHNATAVNLVLPEQGTAGSSVNRHNTASVAASSFSSLLSFASANTLDQLPKTPVVRSWVLRPVAYRAQRKSEDVYDTAWFMDVQDEEAHAARIESQSLAQFLYTDTAATQSLRINMRPATTWTLNLTQRAMGSKAVLIWMILGVVAIYHLVNFAEFLFHLLWASCCKPKQGGLVRVAQTTESQSVQQRRFQNHLHPNQIAPQPQPPAAVMRYPPAQPLQDNYPMPPLAQLYPMPPPPPMRSASTLQPAEGNWSSFEPFGAGSASRPVTPGNPGVYGAGSTGMHSQPITPHFATNPNSTLAEDRARFARQRTLAAQQAHTPGGGVRHYAQDDSRIEIEMSQNQRQRGGFEM